MTRSELAKAAYCSPYTIDEYEAGRRIPRVDIALTLARALEVSLDYLCEGVNL